MAVTESYAPSGLSHYVWWFPGSPVRVHVSLDVIRRLKEQIQIAGPKVAGEGLLFGKALEGATEILDFQPAAGSVSEAVATVSQDGGKQLLVGYYRTEAGDRIRLNDGDLSLARDFFAQPYQVFLIIQPTGFGPPNASFFFHDGDGKMAEFSLMEFPFQPSLLAGEERDWLKRSQEAAARRSAALQPAAPVQRQPGSSRRIVFAVAGLLGLLLCVAGIWANSRTLQQWWSRVRVARAADPPSAALPLVPAFSALAVGLRARRDNADIDITWNRASPVIAAATSGVLSIQDGKARRDIVLDGTQVRNSSVMYSPTADQISMQLSVTTSVSTVIESVMLLLPKNGPATIYTLPISKPPTTVRPLKPFTPPSAATSEPGMPRLPLLAQGLDGRADSAYIPTLIAQPAMPPAPAAAPLNGASDTPASGAPAPKAAVYHAAEPIRRIVPQIPAQLLTMTAPVAMAVRVAIDQTGRVTHAEAAPHPGVNKLVLNSLVTAARSWTFTPARRGDQPIASDFVLQFYFGRPFKKVD